MAKKAKPTKKEAIIFLEQKLPEVPNRSPYDNPTMHLVKDGKGSYLIVPERRPSKTLLVNQIRQEVDAWRDKNYPGASDISKRLLEWWFEESHYIDGKEFTFYFCQREAIETIIYLYEIKGIKDNAEIAIKYMDPQAYGNDLFTERRKVVETVRNERILTRVVPETGQVAQQELPPPDLTRYAVKMATGSGKTLVMALSAVWSYFHKKFEKDSALSKTFLIIAPNIIVFERLRLDFENGIIFRKYPMIPPEWRHDWQMTCIMRGESRKSSTDGALYLTNIHQLYEDKDNGEGTNPVERLLGAKPKKEVGSWEEDILERVSKHDDLLIMNDEAHHVHDTELEWYKVIIRLHEDLKERLGRGISLDLDFSATPKDQNGTFFPWIICDYPLAQAIEDRIVKTPLIVHQTDKADPEKYTRASVAYAEWINIAMSRWKEHYEAYGKVGKKPVLFIMAENTKDADDIYTYLQGLNEFKGKHSLLIHTDKTGEVSKKDLEIAREAARSIDLADNKIRAVVSVMMLREGWDVQNVSVILGLRPFTAKANILPEQAVGRGLRLMRGIGGPDCIQIVEIIGTQKFEEFVKGLEVEGVGIGVTKAPPPLGVHIYPMKVKAEYDIELPILTPSHTREFKGLESFDVSRLPANPLNLALKEGIAKKVELIETVTQKKVGQKQVEIEVGYPESYIILQNITNRVMKEARIEGQFAMIYPHVKKYIGDIFFGRAVDIDHEAIRRQLCDSKIVSEIISVLASTIGKYCVSKSKPEMKTETLRLMEIDGFYWRRDWTELDKTVFNVTPCYNDFEKRFAEFLDKAGDITKFSKLAETYTKFSIEYLSARGAIRYYYPDFVAEQKLKNGKTCMWIIETKGWEDKDVPNKDARAEDWCKTVTDLTGIKWAYLKVQDSKYRYLTDNFSKQPCKSFAELNELLKSKQKSFV